MFSATRQIEDARQARTERGFCHVVNFLGYTRSDAPVMGACLGRHGAEPASLNLENQKEEQHAEDFTVQGTPLSGGGIAQRCAMKNWVKRPMSSVNTNDLAWTAGLLEGEGSVGLYLRNRANSAVYGMICIWNTDISMLQAAQAVLIAHGVPSVRLTAAKRIKLQDTHVRKTAYRIVISDKFSVAVTLRLLVPFMRGAKKVLAMAVLSFTERQASVMRYKMTDADAKLCELTHSAQRDFGGPLNELSDFLSQIGDMSSRAIPTEATRGLVRFGYAGNRQRRIADASVEPLETRSVTPKNNQTHERPTSLNNCVTGSLAN